MLTSSSGDLTEPPCEPVKTGETSALIERLGCCFHCDRARIAAEVCPRLDVTRTAPHLGDPRRRRFCHDRSMTSDPLSSFSNQLADAIATAAPSVVQVQGRRRPASGLVYAESVVLTTTRALGREDDLHVRRHDGRALDARLARWMQ